MRDAAVFRPATTCPKNPFTLTTSVTLASSRPPTMWRSSCNSGNRLGEKPGPPMSIPDVALTSRLCLLFIHPPAHGSEVSPAARNTLDSARIPRASKLLICGLFQKGRVLAQDAVAADTGARSRVRAGSVQHLAPVLLPLRSIVHRVVLHPLAVRRRIPCRCPGTPSPTIRPALPSVQAR